MARSLRSLSASVAAAPTHGAIFTPHPKKSACHHPLRQRQPASVCIPPLNHARFSKSRLNFLDLLRAGHTDYVLNDAAYGYMRKHALAAPLIARLMAEPQTR